MKNVIRQVTLGLALTASAFATAGQNELALCRAHVPNGTDLIFKVQQGPQVQKALRWRFDGGGAQGTVNVRPVAPLKIQYPAHFAVQSSWSKRWRIQIGADQASEGVYFLMRSEGDLDSINQFPATISYGRPDLTYRAQCRYQQADN